MHATKKSIARLDVRRQDSGTTSGTCDPLARKSGIVRAIAHISRVRLEYGDNESIRTERARALNLLRGLK